VFLKRQDELRKAESTQVKIGGVRVGIVGLDDALEAINKRKLETDSEIGDALVELLRPNNYIPDAALDEYRAGLARYYQVRMGLPTEKQAPVSGILEIKVFGRGPDCGRCMQIFNLVRDVVAEEGIAADLEYIDELAELLNYGLFITPALVINGEVKLAGEAPTKNQLVAWLKEAGS